MGFWRAEIGDLKEFWELAPREVDAVVNQFFQSEDLWQFRIGTLGSIALNVAPKSKKHKARKWKWNDICPPFLKGSARKRGMSLDEMRSKAAQMRREVYAWKYQDQLP